MSDAAKAELRERLLGRRRALGDAAIATARLRVREHVLARQAELGWATVAAYRPMRTEPGSTELLDELVRRGARVLVPVTRPDRDLEWTELPDGRALTVDAIGAADAVLVPALAVALDGARLGRGGGSYDRALLRARPDAVVAALLHDGEAMEQVPADAWDVPVTAHVTPGGGWVELTPRARGNR